jgi:hypothetical protein
MGYSIYTPVRSEISRQAASAFDKKDRKRPDFHVRVYREIVAHDPKMINTLETRILTDEVSWEKSGFPMYFPDSPELLQMLWRAKVNVRVEDLGLDTFPRAFAFSWPECQIEGVQPRGCLIWWGNAKDMRVAAVQFEKMYFRDVMKTPVISDEDNKEIGIHLSYPKEDPLATQNNMRYSYYRASIPASLFSDGLASDEGFKQHFMCYNNTAMVGVLAMGPEEMHIQYVTFKLAMRMLVYMRACPEFIREGFPGGKNRKAFEGRWMDFKPNVVGSPARLTGGTHDSPMAHLRSWFFRRYPTRKDGTRQGGVLFVNATMVNADVEAKTIEEGGTVE